MKNQLFTALLIAGCLALGACSKGGNNAAPGAANSGAAAAPARSDAEFAREAFGSLATGDAAAEGLIDWENLTAMGEDYGVEYRGFPEDARAGERKAFVEGFSQEFKNVGGDVQRITNWREDWRDGDRVTVIADMPTGAELHVTVKRRDGRQLISGLDVVEREEGAGQR